MNLMSKRHLKVSLKTSLWPELNPLTPMTPIPLFPTQTHITNPTFPGSIREHINSSTAEW